MQRNEEDELKEKSMIVSLLQDAAVKSDPFLFF